jgi:hypothetical protein
MENTPHIFISYSAKDRSFVEKKSLLLWKQRASTSGASKRTWKRIGRGKLLPPWRIVTLPVRCGANTPPLQNEKTFAIIRWAS